MKNLLVLLMVCALIGSASAWGLADAENPYTFSTDGNLTDMTPDVWGTWGGDSASAGSVVVSGGVCTFTTNSYEIAFSHDNALADIGDPIPGVDDVEVHFDVISISAGASAIVKIEMHPEGNSFPNPDNGLGSVRVDAWDPDIKVTGPGHYSWSTAELGGPIDATTVAITPVVGVTGGTAEQAVVLVIDNLWVGKAGTFSTTKATSPIPGNKTVPGNTVSALNWTNPDPNNLGDTITSDVYFLDAGLSPLTQDPNMGPDVTDPGVTQIADDITVETVAVAGLVDDHYYYWAVHCTDSGTGVTIQGDTWYFYTGDAVPVADAGENQYNWVAKDDGDADPITYTITVTGTYTDDGRSPIADANFLNLSWGWDPDGADDIQGNEDDQRGVEEISQTWTHNGPGGATGTPNEIHTAGTVVAVYKTHYVEGDPTISTDIPGWWDLQLQVTDGAGTGTDVVTVRVDVDCATAVAEDPSDNWNGYYDTNNDCVVGLPDFADFAAKWLDQSVKYE